VISIILISMLGMVLMLLAFLFNSDAVYFIPFLTLLFVFLLPTFTAEMDLYEQCGEICSENNFTSGYYWIDVFGDGAGATPYYCNCSEYKYADALSKAYGNASKYMTEVMKGEP